MYSKEEKLRAVELFIKYDFSPQSVINELGYPCRGSLCSRVRIRSALGRLSPEEYEKKHMGEGRSKAA